MPIATIIIIALIIIIMTTGIYSPLPNLSEVDFSLLIEEVSKSVDVAGKNNIIDKSPSGM